MAESTEEHRADVDPTLEYNLLQLRDKVEQEEKTLEQLQATIQQHQPQMAALRQLLEQLAAQAGVDLTQHEPPPAGTAEATPAHPAPASPAPKPEPEPAAPHGPASRAEPPTRGRSGS